MKNDIAPYRTLYHWDLPQALEDEGGWQNRSTAHAFADYAGYTAGKLSERFNHSMTMNEMSSFIENGYGTGYHAPGLSLPLPKLPSRGTMPCLGTGWRSKRSARRPGGKKLGLAENANPCLPAVETNADIEAVHKAMPEQNAKYLTVILEGRYTDHYLAQLGAAAPKFSPSELKLSALPWTSSS